MDSPPTYHQGTLLFGCADGWVYCLNAADGRLVWRFRGAPAERLIGVDGQLESAWPVHGSVLVQNDVAYFTAGRSSHLDGGLRVYGLAADTGELRYQTLLVRPELHRRRTCQRTSVRRWACCPTFSRATASKLYLRGTTLDNDLQPATGKPPAARPRRLPGRQLLQADSLELRQPSELRPADRARRPTVLRRAHVRQPPRPGPHRILHAGRQGLPAVRQPAGRPAKHWSYRVPVRIRAMLLAGDRLLTAGPPDVVDPQDPLGAFEGRKGGVLYVYNAATGERIAEQKLPSPPVFNGIAAARGRLFLAAENGELSGYGKP